MLLIIWAVIIVAALTLYLRQVYSRFSRHGVKHFRTVPFLGNMMDVTLRINHISDDIERLYKAYPNERFVGRYEFTNPMLMIHDIELVKKITVKDFEHFIDHRAFVDEQADPFFGRNLFSLKGQEWKDMRSTLSPAFTSSKMRLMLPFMVEVGNQMVLTLKNKIKQSGVGYTDLEGKDLTTRYANDVIASCAFGLKVNSHAEQDNEFYKMGKQASTFNYKQLLKFFGFVSFPKLMTLLKVSLFSDETKHFFKNVVMSTMRDREAHNIIRPDMIHLLMEAKKGQLVHDEKTSQDADAGFATVEESSVGKKDINRVWSDDDLIAQAVLFFIAGFETVSSAMSFSLNELTTHPEVQEKLAQEIKENEIKNGGKFDYNSIQNMTYMDMVVSEVLRLWPPALALDRVCIKDYNLGRANDNTEKDYIIREGDGLNIPVWNFHRDPQYFPDPLKFDPERFSNERKHNINPLAYIPFGVGPRNCIGSRFALCEVKVMLYQLLQHFELSPCEKTCIPTVLSKENINMTIKGGQWMRLKIRQ
nr:cytochrome P450 monooxygenase CYP9A198 [Ephestia elutella]